MNPANHGQCHIRRNSRDERAEGTTTTTKDPQTTTTTKPAGVGGGGGHSRNSASVPGGVGGASVPGGVGGASVPGGIGGASVSGGVEASEATDSEPSPSSDQSLQGEERLLLRQQISGRDPPEMAMRSAVVSQRPYPKPPRGRSGSWSGVNESEDELERMAEAMQHPPAAAPQIKVTGAEHNGGSVRRHYGSVTSSVTSLSSANHYPHPFDESTTTTTTTGLFSPDVTPERMRRRLKFYFMDPIEKWQAKRRFPWKLLLQIFKILVVTAQLCLFAQQRFSHVNYLWDTKISFSHLFIEGWDSSREINVYPPGSGPLAVYKKSEFYKYLDFAVVGFATIEEQSIGTLNYDHKNGSMVNSLLCVSQYASGEVLDNGTYVLDSNETRSCYQIPTAEINATAWSTERFLKDTYNFTFNFDLLLNTEFIFQLRTIKLRVNLPYETPECYRLVSKVEFNNHDHDGQMLLSMDVSARVLECHGSVDLATAAWTIQMWRTVVNIMSIIICFISLMMCVRAIYRAQVLRQATVLFFKRHFDKDLTVSEKMAFVNLWYILICVNDVLIIIGSFIKIGIENKHYVIHGLSQVSSPQFFLEEEERSYQGYLDTWNVCSLFLGLGNLFVWFGCLRYLGFFATYNVLILTIKKCIPNVLRFSICLLMVFAGYCLCGWLVLGPYHLKFRSFSSTMECLYSLINGDDMFATFSSTSGKDPVVWWFSRIYLYTFISLFIYVILSLFIAIIMDAYETIKNYHIDGFPVDDLMKFVNECREGPTSGVFHDVGDRTIHDVINSICCCGQQQHGDGNGDEYEPLIS
ncbi:hypothetical protein Pcinc_024913 [Petrolisthes cinctipes]|uniref:Mucolipin-3 n=1 Tax=Petrolisthes cinctipes TaxID=88211 RepID=A0AAE1F8X3_PETCI|nr:hypothetical protein Pcinc_024913 [Petrolisthes cinctipes]